jgi:hypothetical protein
VGLAKPTSTQAKVAEIADGNICGENALEDWLRTPPRHGQLWDKENTDKEGQYLNWLRGGHGAVVLKVLPIR